MPNKKENPGAGGAAFGAVNSYSEQGNNSENDNFSQEQNGNRDRPLSLHHDFKPIKSALYDLVGRRLTDTEAAIIVALCQSGEVCSYSRNPHHYSMPGRYRTSLYSHRKVAGGMDRLAADGLIWNWKQEKGTRGWQSTCAATPELIEKYAIVTDGHEAKLIVPREPIVMRDAEKNLVDYKDNAKTKSMRRSLCEYNDALNDTAITGVDKGSIRRIFNGDFKHGGRGYADGGSWQQLRGKATDEDGNPVPMHLRRSSVKINGEAVSELDYKNLHPRLLYARLGINPPADCYAVPGFHRDLAKVALLIMLNARSRHGAVSALAKKDVMEKTGTAVIASHEAHNAANGVLAKLCDLHEPISQFFFTGIGSQLMALDGDIAQAVMDRMLRAGVVVLPVHDSFMVARSKADLLGQIMMEVSSTKCGMIIPVEAKY
ncbi:hypothetical protein [Thalassospira indica]|uniref:Uncharacterized protein n=1 Tax=Thalassospira indica TaxID=1891279 RepID=A0ABM6XZ60_9PROT|nr:hypothetical protein [Thalassospira indica]AXO13304.1 hypothetical protein DY252_02805 [Thalassospira indica]OAZ14825.1 hypothetical protein TH15_03235 [Thalassospira profundimaris]